MQKLSTSVKDFQSLARCLLVIDFLQGHRINGPNLM